MSEILCVYIAGRYTDKDPFVREQNIFRAREVGYEVAKAGFMPVIPHASSAHFDALQTPEWWYTATLELLRRCDLVVLVPGWRESTGTTREVEEANRRLMPVCGSVYDAIRWRDGRGESA